MFDIDALMYGGESLTVRRVTGLAVGFLGIVFLVGPDIRLGSGGGFLTGVIAAQIACAGWAEDPHTRGDEGSRKTCWRRPRSRCSFVAPSC